MQYVGYSAAAEMNSAETSWTVSTLTASSARSLREKEVLREAVEWPTGSALSSSSSTVVKCPASSSSSFSSSSLSWKTMGYHRRQFSRRKNPRYFCLARLTFLKDPGILLDLMLLAFQIFHKRWIFALQPVLEGIREPSHLGASGKIVIRFGDCGWNLFCPDGQQTCSR